MAAAKWSSLYKQVFPILIGTAVYAFAIHYFLIPNELMEGGVTGITLLLNYAFEISPSISTLALNIPLFFLGWRMFGGPTMVYTILGVLSLTLFLGLFEWMIAEGWLVPFDAEGDYFLATLYAGVTLGAGLGIVFRAGGTTGGSDIIARIGNKLRGWSMGQVILAIDVVVLGTSLLYIEQRKILYTLVVVFIAARVIDFIQEGAYAAKAFMIVSDRSEEIAERVTKEMEHGVTLYKAVGAYSKQDKQVAYCVVYRHEVRKLKSLVRQVDPRAFMVIEDVHDVLGEGFREE